MKHLFFIIAIFVNFCIIADDAKTEPLKQYEFPLKTGDNIFFCVYTKLDGENSKINIIKPLYFRRIRPDQNIKKLYGSSIKVLVKYKQQKFLEKS